MLKTPELPVKPCRGIYPVYGAKDNELLILVIEIAHRKAVYQ